MMSGRSRAEWLWPRGPAARDGSVFGGGVGALALGRFTRLARRAADHLLEVVELDEVVGLTAQLVRDHRRLAADGRDHGDAHALTLQALDQRFEIAVAGEEHDVIDPRRELHGVDAQL